MEHVIAIAQSAQRTDVTDMEEFFCLMGTAVDGDYQVLGVIMPLQRALNDTLVDGFMMDMVVSRDCPPGTIGDVHTHPSGDPVPSWNIDIPNWNRNRRYTLHLIAFVYENDFDRVGIAAYDYHNPDRPRGLVGNWLKTGGT